MLQRIEQRALQPEGLHETSEVNLGLTESPRTDYKVQQNAIKKNGLGPLRHSVLIDLIQFVSTPVVLSFSQFSYKKSLRMNCKGCCCLAVVVVVRGIQFDC